MHIKQKLAIYFIFLMILPYYFSLECNINLGKEDYVNIGNCDITNKTIDINFDGKKVIGNISIINSNVSFYKINFNGSIVLYNSNLFLNGSLIPLNNTNIINALNSNVIIEINSTNIIGPFYIAYINNSNLTFYRSVLMNIYNNAYIKCINSSINFNYSLIYDLNTINDACFFSLANSFVNNKKSRIAQANNEVISDEYFYLELYNSSNILIDGSVENLFLINVSNITINGTITSSLFAVNSSISLNKAKFLNNAGLLLIDSYANITKTFFCTDADYYIKAINSSVFLDENYYRDIRLAYENKEIDDLNNDYRADAGLLWPYKSKKFIGIMEDKNPVFAYDIACILRPLKGPQKLDLNISYNCTEKSFNVSLFYLGFPINADLLLTSKETGIGKTFQNVSNVKIYINDSSLYFLTATKGGYEQAVAQLLAYECFEQGNNKTSIINIKIEKPDIAYENEEIKITLLYENGSYLSNVNITIDTPYGAIKKVSDENGSFSFIPLYAGLYNINVQGYRILNNASLYVGKKPIVYKSSLDIKLSNSTTAVIGPDRINDYNITIRKDGKIIFKRDHVNGLVRINLSQGNYNIYITSNNQFSSIIVNYEIEPKSFSLSLEYITSTAIAIFFLFLIFYKRQSYKYKANIDVYTNGLVKCIIRDFYNMPIKEAVKVIKDGDLIFSGYADEYGAISFILNGPGLYEIKTKNYKIRNGLFRIKRAKNGYEIEIIK